MPKSTDIAKKEEVKNAEIAVRAEAMTRPSFIPSDTRGIEHLQKDDLQMPRLALAQKMSPQLETEDPSYIENLKIGQLFNSLTQQIYGKGPIEFVVLRSDVPRYVEFIPRSEGGGIKDFNVPANDPRTQFTTDEDGKRNKPLATKFYDFIVMLLPSREIIALSLKSTGLKTARSLNTLMKLRNAPIFSGKYVMTTTSITNPKGTFSGYQIKNSDIESADSAVVNGKLLPGWVSEELFAIAGQAYDAFKDREIVIDREADHDDVDIPEAEAAEATEGSTDFDTSKM